MCDWQLWLFLVPLCCHLLWPSKAPGDIILHTDLEINSSLYTYTSLSIGSHIPLCLYIDLLSPKLTLSFFSHTLSEAKTLLDIEENRTENEEICLYREIEESDRGERSFKTKFPIKHKSRSFEECSCCSFLYNQSIHHTVLLTTWFWLVSRGIWGSNIYENVWLIDQDKT